jgi:hypothetical protein
MDTAIIGFLGVIAGAVVTGGVQAVTAHLDRRRGSRSAARLLYVTLHVGRSAIEDLKATHSWGPTVTDWDAFGVSWDQHSEALARVLGTKDFILVSSAFACLKTLASGYRRDTTEPPAIPGGSPNFSPPDKTLELYHATVKEAATVILKAAFTRREIRRGEYPSSPAGDVRAGVDIDSPLSSGQPTGSAGASKPDETP